MEEVLEVTLFDRRGPFGYPVRFAHHSWWWEFWAHFIPFLLFLALIGLVVWAVLRLSGRTQLAAAAGVAPGVRADPALEEVRLRYARGEMSREEFVQRSQDLGGEFGRPTPTEPLTPTEPSTPVEPPTPEAG